MQTVGKSNLLNKTFRMAGFGFAPHPLHRARFVNVVVYKVRSTTEDEFVICMGEGEGAGDPGTMREGLAQDVPGHMIAPYAAREIVGMGYDKVQSVLNQTLPESMPGLKMEWASGSVL